jgi:hypothetical protein
LMALSTYQLAAFTTLQAASISAATKQAFLSADIDTQARFNAVMWPS